MSDQLATGTWEAPALDWHAWLQSWDEQQAGHQPWREERFAAMLDVLAALLPATFVAVDLGCGPGSLSQRLLIRFPQARSIAVDLDPVLLALGGAVLGDMQGRLHWVEADLRDPNWRARLGVEQVDAVLSTTALHWLPGGQLVQLYEQLGELMRPGGVFLNGDRMSFPPHMPSFARVATIGREKLEDEARQRGVASWTQWWEMLAREPGMQPLLAERDRRFAWRARDDHPIVDLHEAALRAAGFREVGIIWQRLDNRVVMAVR